MKTQLLIALTCSSLAFADRGNNHSNSAPGASKGNDFSNAAIYVDHPADTTKGNDFSNGKAKSKKGNDFSNGASGSGGVQLPKPFGVAQRIRSIFNHRKQSVEGRQKPRRQSGFS